MGGAAADDDDNNANTDNTDTNEQLQKDVMVEAKIWSKSVDFLKCNTQEIVWYIICTIQLLGYCSLKNHLITNWLSRVHLMNKDSLSSMKPTLCLKEVSSVKFQFWANIIIRKNISVKVSLFRIMCSTCFYT